MAGEHGSDLFCLPQRRRRSRNPVPTPTTRTGPALVLRTNKKRPSFRRRKRAASRRKRGVSQKSLLTLGCGTPSHVFISLLGEGILFWLKNPKRIRIGEKMSIPAVCFFGDLQEAASSSSFEAEISSFGGSQQGIYAVSPRIRCAELSFSKGYRLKIKGVPRSSSKPTFATPPYLFHEYTFRSIKKLRALFEKFAYGIRVGTPPVKNVFEKIEDLGQQGPLLQRRTRHSDVAPELHLAGVCFLVALLHFKEAHPHAVVVGAPEFRQAFRHENDQQNMGVIKLMESSNEIFQLKNRKFTFPHLQKSPRCKKHTGRKNHGGFPFKKRRTDRGLTNRHPAKLILSIK